MDTRAVLSYDDITEPSLPAPSEEVYTTVESMNNKSPAKRPRWTKPNARGGPPKRPRLHAEAHWDSSIEPTSIVSYDPIDTIPPSTSDHTHTPLRASAGASAGQPKPRPSHSHSSSPSQKRMPATTSNGNGYFKKEQQYAATSVPLGDKDAWDDSSLIEAWEAANEEYERLNGPGKKWKDEPLVKSSLWYGTRNTSKSKAAAPPPPIEGEETFEEGYYEQGDESEQRKLENEDAQEVPAADNNTITPTSFPDITQLTQNASDYTTQEVFQQALNSAWWLGYWSAMHQIKVNASPAEEENEPINPSR